MRYLIAAILVGWLAVWAVAGQAQGPAATPPGAEADTTPPAAPEVLGIEGYEEELLPEEPAGGEAVPSEETAPAPIDEATGEPQDREPPTPPGASTWTK